MANDTDCCDNPDMRLVETRADGTRVYVCSRCAAKEVIAKGDQ